MIANLVMEMGPWVWLVGGLILLGLELVIPGIFLLWIGAAAMAVGLLSLALWESGIWPWQVQIILFAILAIAASYLGKKVYTDAGQQSDQPMLNQRTQSLIGRVATLEEPIENGRGRVKLDDTLWVVEGPDAEIGADVKVISAHSNRLNVTLI